MGAEVLCVPAQFQYATGKDHWEVLLRARAIENQCFVVAPGQWGTFGDPEKGRRSYGNSMVVDPWGGCWSARPRRATASGSRTSTWPSSGASAQVLPALQHRRLGLTC